MTLFERFRIGRKPVAIAVHNGSLWYVGVFAFLRGDWHHRHDRWVEGGHPFELPGDLLEWAVSRGARRLRVLVPREPLDVELALPEDIEEDEAQAAVALEVSGRTGSDPFSIRVAMAQADRYRMGGSAGRMVAAAFENAHLDKMSRACVQHKLVFEGMGSFEQALLNLHARLSNHRRCLLLLPTGCFYVAPAIESQPFLFQSFPMTFRPDEVERHPERYERLERRLQTHRTHPVSVWSAESLSPERHALIRELFGESEELFFCDLREQMTGLALRAAHGGEIDHPRHGTALVGPRKVSDDPHRAGTVICVTMVAGCAALLGWMCWDNHRSLVEARQRETAWEALVAERAKLKSEADAKRVERDKHQTVVRELKNEEILPAGFLETLQALRQSMPPYTRLTRLFQKNALPVADAPEFAQTGRSTRKKGGAGAAKAVAVAVVPPAAETEQELILEGISYSQPSVMQLNQSLSRLLGPERFRVNLGGIEQLDEPNALAFELRITPNSGERP